MTSYTISPIWGAGAQLFDNSGNVLSGGKIYTYYAGSTTPLATYTTPTGSTANSNPIVANSAGRLTNEIWFPVSGAYKFVLKDANDVLLATYDNIPTTPQPPIVNDASSVAYEPGYEVTAGNFTIGATYLITSVGTTDFVAIGAAANQTGIHFTATGVGSGTGTAEYSRYVQDKLRETVSVKDFGAVGDGVTDDTAAIQEALNNSSGRILKFLDNETYLVYALKVLADTVLDFGTATIKKRPATSSDQTLPQFTGNTTIWWSTSPILMAPVFYVTGDNVVFKNGTIDGDKDSETYGLGTWGGSFAVEGNRCGILASHSAISSVQSITVDGVSFVNMYGNCIVTEYMIGTTRIQNCKEYNSGSMFSYLLGEANPPTYTGKSGSLFFTNNYINGVRENNTIPNPGIIDGFRTLTFSNNVVTGVNQASSGGFKIGGNSYQVDICNNVFDWEYIKPQSAVTSLGDNFNCSNNVFKTLNPDTHQTGCIMGLAAFTTLIASDNNLLNGQLNLEASSSNIICSGNNFKFDDGALPSGAPWVSAINITKNIAGAIANTALIENNVVDGKEFDNHVSVFVGSGCGQVSIRNNKFYRMDRVIFVDCASSSTIYSQIDFSDNYVDNYRGIGRISLGSYNALIVKGNVFKYVNPTAPVYPIGTSSRSLYITAAGTPDAIFIDNNIVDIANVTTAEWLNIPNTGTVGLFTITNNIVNAGKSGNYNVIWGAAGNSASEFIFKNNYFNYSVYLGGTVTTQIVSGNTFPDGYVNGLVGTTKLPVEFNGDLATTVGAAGGGSALPATPVGYAQIQINGTAYKIPYFNV